MDLTKDNMDFSLKLQNSNITTETAAATTESSNKNCQGSPLKIGLIEVEGNTISMNTFDKLQKSSTPELLENAAKMATKVAADGQLTPPPRPMTSSEVVGFTIFEDTEMNLDPTLGIKPCRSLPASPNHLKSIQMPPLFDFRSSKPFVAAASAPEAEPKVIKLSADEPDIAKRKFKPAPCNNNSQQFCLRWNNYQNNLTNVFDELLQNESFVDVTLACEGQSIKAHKMVLSACSPYFQALFYDNPCQHPIVIMRDVGWQELKTLMEFMYKGEINVSQDQINPLLRVAEMLKIRGLAEVSANRMATATQHPLILEQRMTVYESDEEKNNVASDTVNGKSRCSGGVDLDESQAAKRPRLNAEIESDDGAKQDLQNLHAVRMRKRSRDGHLIDGDRFSNNKNYDNLHASSPAHEEHISANPSIAGSVATALTTSTIVRNPFASPPNQLSQTSSNAENEKICSPNELPASYRSMARNCSPSQSSNSGDVGVRSALVSPTDTNQLPLHARPAADVAAAFTNPNHPHHRAAQQLAAHHQLHAAAQSHAAMATALAAAASGTNTIPGVSNTSSTTVNTPTPLHDDMEIKPEIAEMIREEERAKLIESGHPWSGGGSTNSSVTESYQYQLQSMWQKCWSTNQQNLVQQLRFRERGPLKSWRPEAMAEAIFSVLKEGLSLSQAARKYDIPYPTFVLYANRVHNMLGPSLDGGSDPRPKARGRPQRILLGMWPEELIRSVIKAVVFRDYREFKDDMGNLPFVNGQPHMSTHFASPNAIMTNGLPTAAKLAQNAAVLASQDSASPLNTMTENFRRHLISQQQQQQQQHQSPVSQSVNMYKSPAYLQRSEMDEASLEMVALAKQKNERRLPDNLADLNKLGLMGIPGMSGGVMPTASSRGNQMPTNLYQTECDLEHDRERNRAKEREFKDTMQARQFGGRSVVPGGDSRMQSSLSFSSRSTSPYTSYLKGKEANQSVYNKRLLDSLPPGIDFEAIANGLLQKSVSKSPRFEDLFSGQEMNEILINPEANAVAAPPNTSSCSSPQRDHLMKIKLEQQQIGDMPHED